MAKGQEFERKLATRLSLWWSGGRHDDLIWRSSMSGGRATVRGRAGKRTQGHAGDLCPTGNGAARLFMVFAFELKCGYQRVTINDLIDRPKQAAYQKDGWDGWIEQAEESKRMSGALSWMLIHHRTKGPKRTMVYIDVDGWGEGDPVFEYLITLPKSMSIQSVVKKPDGSYRAIDIMAFRLESLIGVEGQKFDKDFRAAITLAAIQSKRKGKSCKPPPRRS